MVERLSIGEYDVCCLFRIGQVFAAVGECYQESLFL